MGISCIDRRLFLGASAGAFAASRSWALGPPALTSDQDPALAALYEAAKKEGELTWYVGHWPVAFAEVIGKAFGDTYPGVKCNVVWGPSQTIYQKFTIDAKAGAVICDLFSTADGGQLLTLGEDKKLVAYEPKNLVYIAPIIRDYDPKHTMFVTDANPTLMAYNTDLVKPEDAPTKWTDFIDPKWKDQVALAHPGFSGSMGAWVLAMNKLYGWDYFEKLAKNKPLVGKSMADPPITISNGERKLGICVISSPARFMAERNAPIKPAFPSDGAILNIGLSSLIAGSKHPNAAKLFLEFLMTKPVGELASKQQFVMPVRADVTAAAGVPSLGSLKGITTDPEEMAKVLPGLVDKWRDTFGV